MKKMRQTLTFLLLFSAFAGFSQQADECNIKYNLFKGEFKAGNYANAYTDWLWVMDNCPTLSVNVYKYGIKIAEDRLENASPLEKEAAIQLVERVYLQRLEHYPQDKASIYDDLASFKAEQEASQEEVYSWLDKSFKASAGEMSARNYYRYFDIILNMYTDTDPQRVFETYDQVTEALDLKRSEYVKKIDVINAKDSLTLTAKEKNSKLVYQQIIENVALVEAGLDVKLSAISNCDNLIPLNKKYFEENRDNAVWLRRAVSRMYNKECTDDPFYDTLVEAYVKADPSPQASVFYAGILMKKGETNKAMEYFKQAVDQEPDTYKKANYLLKIAQILAKQGRKSEARANCYKALEYSPTSGNAYLLISSLYASSANTCGDDLVSKRMVYVAALNMAQKAKAVDPSIASTANKYINSYAENIPTKKDLFVAGIESGTKHTIGCWINITVIVP
jgi:tetratricopeptide (TPR) repeat protein